MLGAAAPAVARVITLAASAATFTATTPPIKHLASRDLTAEPAALPTRASPATPVELLPGDATSARPRSLELVVRADAADHPARPRPRTFDARAPPNASNSA
jgi:hypothetical protein